MEYTVTKYFLILILLSGLFISCSSDKKAAEDHTVDTIREFLQTLAFQKVDECYPGPQSWPQAALLKKSIDIEYKFSDDCKMKGKFVASYLDPVPMSFDLKDFDGFTKANALVKLHIIQHRNGVYYGYEIKEATLMGSGKVVSFTSKYKVDTDPLTNEIKAGSEKGEINVLVPGTKKIKSTYPLTFH